MFKPLGRLAVTRATKSPWTNVYGLARSLLALATLGTLTFSTSTVLFHPVQGLPPSPYCSHLACLSLFCVTKGKLDAARWIAIAILAIVVSGWRPRWTAIPHWWIAFSLQASISIPDGGDQLNALLALLLVPAAILDERKWHWNVTAASSPSDGALASVLKRVTAHFFFQVIRLQVALVYFDSAVSKFRVEEWANGTALYYWLNYSIFGVPTWSKGLIDLFVNNPVGVAFLTWGTLILEITLAAGLILPRHVRPYLLGAGLLFHFAIAILMGLGSFSITMIGALLLFLRPVEAPLTMPLTWTALRTDSFASIS